MTFGVSCIFLLCLLSVSVPLHAVGGVKVETQVPTATYQAINNMVGTKLLADDSIWDDADSDLARRMRLRLEGRTLTQASFRSYPNRSESLFGCRPYSVALYSENGKPTYISMVFVNKGDFYAEHQGGDQTFGSERRKKGALRASDIDRMFKKRLKSDGDRISTNVATALGDHKRTVYGKGSSSSTERVNRWDWKGHALILAATRGEHVTLRIMPSAVADRQGRSERKFSDKEMRAILKGRLINRDNGDVIVTEIPMVNQGPKGYCVPATWERYLRYMEIQADMYTLAMAGHTRKGGGTSVEAMSNAAQQIVRQSGRSIKKINSKLSIRQVSKAIDTGSPIMWQMKVVPKLNNDITQRFDTRKEVTDWEAWKQSLKPMRKAASKLRRQDGSGHLCMIIGYNSQTDEIAVSDSWGPAFKERWLTVEEAEAISRELQIISP